MKKYILEAFKKRYAIPQININGLVWIEDVLAAAEDQQSPIILGTTDKNISFLGGYDFIAYVIKKKVKAMNISVPVILHLDHGLSVEGCHKAIDAGYDSVMYDGSKLPIDENVELTRQVVNYAQRNKVYVEGEVGAVGGTEDGLTNDLKYASIEDCKQLVYESGIDTLAPALGSVHGEYKGEPHLDFDRMKQINKMLNIPLVLHGASGLSDEDVAKAISYGHAKINFNTEINMAWSRTLRDYLIDNPLVYNPQEIIKPSTQAIKNKVSEIIKKCNSNNQA